MANADEGHKIKPYTETSFGDGCRPADTKQMTPHEVSSRAQQGLEPRVDSPMVANMLFAPKYNVGDIVRLGLVEDVFLHIAEIFMHVTVNSTIYRYTGRLYGSVEGQVEVQKGYTTFRELELGQKVDKLTV